MPAIPLPAAVVPKVLLMCWIKNSTEIEQTLYNLLYLLALQRLRCLHSKK
jgi:hypothetical protein